MPPSPRSGPKSPRGGPKSPRLTSISCGGSIKSPPPSPQLAAQAKYDRKRIQSRLDEAVASKDINAIKAAQQAADAFNMPDLVLEANVERSKCGNKVRLSKKQRKDQKRLKRLLYKHTYLLIMTCMPVNKLQSKPRRLLVLEAVLLSQAGVAPALCLPVIVLLHFIHG